MKDQGRLVLPLDSKSGPLLEVSTCFLLNKIVDSSEARTHVKSKVKGDKKKRGPTACYNDKATDQEHKHQGDLLPPWDLNLIEHPDGKNINDAILSDVQTRIGVKQSTDIDTFAVHR